MTHEHWSGGNTGGQGGPPDPPIGFGGRIKEAHTIDSKQQLLLDLSELSDVARAQLEADGCLVVVRFESDIVACASLSEDVFSTGKMSVELVGEASWEAPSSVHVLLVPMESHHAAE